MSDSRPNLPPRPETRSGRPTVRGETRRTSRTGSVPSVVPTIGRVMTAPVSGAVTRLVNFEQQKAETRKQELLEGAVSGLDTSTALVVEQNEILKDIIDIIKRIKLEGRTAGDGGGDIDIDLDRDRRGRGGKGQRGKFGARGRERLQRFQKFQAQRGATPKPTTPTRPAAPTGRVPQVSRPPAPTQASAARSLLQGAARILPSLGSLGAVAAPAAVAAGSLAVIGTAAYRAATMSPEERAAIRQRAEEQAATGREVLTEGQRAGRGVGQELRSGYYGDQPADLRLEDILDALDTPAPNETSEQLTARERMATELTRGNGRPTPEMIEYARSRRASSQSATQVQPSPATPTQLPAPVLGEGAGAAAVDDSGSFGLEPATQTQAPPAVSPRQNNRPDQDALTRQGSQFLSAFESAELAEADLKDFENRHGPPDTTRTDRPGPGAFYAPRQIPAYSDPELQAQYEALIRRGGEEDRKGRRVREEAMTAMAGRGRSMSGLRPRIGAVLVQQYGYTDEQLYQILERDGPAAVERLLEQEVGQDLLNRGRRARLEASPSDQPGAAAAPVTPPPPVIPAQQSAPALGEGAGAAAVDDPGSFGLEPVTPPATQVQPSAAAPAPRAGNMLSRLFSRSSASRQAPVLGQGGEAAAVGDAGATGLQPPPATRQVAHTQRELQFLREQVESILTFRNQLDRTEEVMQHMTRGYSNRNIPMSSGLLRARILDYIQLNPGPRSELLERAGQALQEGGQRTLQSLEQQQSGAQAPPVEPQQAQQQVVTTPGQKAPVEPEPQQAAEPRPDTQDLVTRLSSGPAAPMPKDGDDYKAPSESMAKSPIIAMTKDSEAVAAEPIVRSLLREEDIESALPYSENMIETLSKTEFEKIELEADKIVFDGKIKLAKGEFAAPSAAPAAAAPSVAPPPPPASTIQPAEAAASQAAAPATDATQTAAAPVTTTESAGAPAGDSATAEGGTSLATPVALPSPAAAGVVPPAQPPTAEPPQQAPSAPQQGGRGGGDFMSQVNEVSSRLGINPANLLAVMRSESSLNPRAVNSSTGASGLIQFMPRTAQSLGTSVEAIRQMSAAEQMPLVERFFRSVRLPPGASAGKLYAYVFLPGRANREILTQAGENFYEANRGLDVDRDGKITIADLDARLARFGGVGAATMQAASPSTGSAVAGDSAQQVISDRDRARTAAAGGGGAQQPQRVAGRQDAGSTNRAVGSGTGEVPLMKRLQGAAA